MYCNDDNTRLIPTFIDCGYEQKMRMSSLLSASLSLLLLLLPRARCASPAPPRVTVGALGTVTGAVSRLAPSVGVFKGIPYAKPPVGVGTRRDRGDRGARGPRVHD